jgi:molecular chaperone DnaK (HSP70)
MTMFPTNSHTVAAPVRGPARVVGIDLGAGHSRIAEAVQREGERASAEPRCLEIDQETPEGRYADWQVASAVALHDGTVYVGEGARRLWARPPDQKLEQGRSLFQRFKGELGKGKRYPAAPEGYRSPCEVYAKVLRFLVGAATQDGSDPPRRMVVAVPTAFTPAQRQEVRKAVRLAGIKTATVDLVDEPVAAVLDHLATRAGEMVATAPMTNVVVVDLGATACQVAVLRVASHRQDELPEVTLLASDRDTQLGGDAIDAAVARDVLLPQLLRQNDMDQAGLNDADWRSVEPTMLALAESLKVGLSGEIARLERQGLYRDAEPQNVVKREPGAHPCRLADGRILQLRQPSLSAAQLEDALQPLLGSPTGNAVASPIVALVQKVLSKASIEAGGINLLLCVGGGSGLPGVRSALIALFPNAKPLDDGDAERARGAVARGAAYRALQLAGAAPAWFVPRSDLSLDQLRAVVADLAQHRIVLGRAGSGKTVTLVHRAHHLIHECKIPPDRLRIVVYARALKEFLSPALATLGLPRDCLVTFDAWCLSYFRSHIGGSPPVRDGKLDFSAIRAAVRHHVATAPAAPKPYPVLLVDEGQDLGAEDYDILTAVADHVTVCLGIGQHLYAGGSRVEEVCRSLGLARGTWSLLETYRSSPRVVKVAAALLTDPGERKQFLRQARTPGAEELPVLYTADDERDETSRLAEMLRQRQERAERVGILLPTGREVARLAHELRKLKLEVEVQSSGKGRRVFPRLDFEGPLPKLMTIHSAKGLTFDTVMLPRLTARAYESLQVSLAELLFVGVTRAAQWVWLSTIAGQELQVLNQLRPLIESGIIREETGEPLTVTSP